MNGVHRQRTRIQEPLDCVTTTSSAEKQICSQLSRKQAIQQKPPHVRLHTGAVHKPSQTTTHAWMEL